MARSVQFHDLESLCQAYINSDIPAFAIFDQKNPFHAYEGDSCTQGEAEIREMVGMLMKTQSTAIYTLKLYKRLGKDQDITDKTPAVRSWNFRFFAFDGGGAYGGLPTPRGNDDRYVNKLESENAALKLKISELEEELDEVTEPAEPAEDQIGKVTRLLENPMVQKWAMGITSFVQGMMRKGSGQTEQTGQAMNGIGGQGYQGDWMTDQQILQAMDALASTTENLGAVLHKLAQLATLKPDSFKFYKDMLISMKLD